MKKVLNITFHAILLAAAVILPAFADREHRTGTCREFAVEVLNPTDLSLLTAEEIRELVIREIGDPEGKPVGMIDLDRLENKMRGNPYISACEVFITLDNHIELKAMVREPLVRVINSDLQQYLLDYHGYMMPLKPAHPYHLLIANGAIPDRFPALDKTEKPISMLPDTSALRQVYPVAYHIAQDDFLSSFIDQVYVNENGDIELVPKLGHQEIILGDGQDAAEKLENLKMFYLKIMNKINWNTYKTINLKFKNQVVCSK